VDHGVDSWEVANVVPIPSSFLSVCVCVFPALPPQFGRCALGGQRGLSDKYGIDIVLLRVLGTVAFTLVNKKLLVYGHSQLLGEA